MPIAPFAALEARANSAAFARLSNAEVSIDGGPAFGGIFEDAYSIGGVGVLGMASSQPVVMVPKAQVVGDVTGLPILVNGVAYVIGTPEPDGFGAVRLLLEVAL